MYIGNNRDLATAYHMLHTMGKLIETCTGIKDTQKVNEAVRWLKADIRKYQHAQDSKRVYTLVKDYGYDGHIVRFDMPDVDDPEGWFDDNERLTARPSMYDCTGQAFTSWHEFKTLGGRKVCYHSIAYDV